MALSFALDEWLPVDSAGPYQDHSGGRAVPNDRDEPRELRCADAMTAADGMRLGWAPDELLLLVERQSTLLTLASQPSF